MYQVTRKFQENDIQREVGELVSGTGYRYLQRLIELRYLKDVGAEPTSFRCELCEREFISQQALEDHYITTHPDDIEIEDDGKQPEGGSPEGTDQETGKGVKDNEPNNKRKGKSGKADTNVS